MYRIDAICNPRGQMEDVYSELNKWSFESKWLGGLFLPENNAHFVPAETFQLKCDLWWLDGNFQTINCNIMKNTLQKSQGTIIMCQIHQLLHKLFSSGQLAVWLSELCRPVGSQLAHLSNLCAELLKMWGLVLLFHSQWWWLLLEREE